MSKPCLNCESRYIGCHGKCTKYIRFRETLDAAKIKRVEQIQYMSYLSDAIIRMKR